MSAHTTSRYYVSSWSGLIFAGIAGMAATSLIVQDAFPNGWADWSHVKLEHALAPAIVAITAFLWLHAAREAREGRLAALALAVVAAFCSGLIVFESMGRGAEALDTKVKSEEKTVAEYAALITKLDKANKLVEEAERWVAGECRTGKKTKCEGTTFVFDQRKSHAEKLQKEVEAQKAPLPVDARGERVAFLAGLLGYDGEVAKKAAQSLYPLARPLAFEFVMILLLHASVRTRSDSVSVSESVQTVSEPRALSFENEKGDRDAKELDDLKKQFLALDREVQQVLKALLSSDRPLTNDETAKLMKVQKSEASKRNGAAAADGWIRRWKQGKFVYAEPTEKGRMLLSLVA